MICPKCGGTAFRLKTYLPGGVLVNKGEYDKKTGTLVVSGKFAELVGPDEAVCLSCGTKVAANAKGGYILVLPTTPDLDEKFEVCPYYNDSQCTYKDACPSRIEDKCSVNWEKERKRYERFAKERERLLTPKRR